MKAMREILLLLLFAASLSGTAWALDLKLTAGHGNELVIRKDAIQSIYTRDGKIYIGTASGNFEITPVLDDAIGLGALKSAIDELLEREKPRSHGEVLKEFEELQAIPEKTDFTMMQIHRLALLRRGNDWLECSSIEQY
jgi:hypothetical protein